MKKKYSVAVISAKRCAYGVHKQKYIIMFIYIEKPYKKDNLYMDDNEMKIGYNSEQWEWC